jgi:hypothetical protein
MTRGGRPLGRKLHLIDVTEIVVSHAVTQHLPRANERRWTGQIKRDGRVWSKVCSRRTEMARECRFTGCQGMARYEVRRVSPDGPAGAHASRNRKGHNRVHGISLAQPQRKSVRESPDILGFEKLTRVFSVARCRAQEPLRSL